ncbi:MAG: hypothetical protein U0359_30250 [Byssovorax sp.]
MTDPAPPALDAQALRDLRDRHLAFLRTRLTSAAAEAEWKANFAGITRDFLAMKLGALCDSAAIGRAIEAAIAADLVEKAARPAARRALALTLAELRNEKGTLGARVPAPAREKIDKLLTRPGLLPERLLRELVEQEAVEEMMRDVLYDALKEFSEKVNPFVAEWGLPALLKRLGPFGMGKGFESMRADFDKRLEPEIRKFLKGFSKKALRQAVQGILDKADEPKSIAVRRHLAAWTMSQEIAQTAKSADAEAIALAQEIGLDLLAAELGREASRARVRAMLDEAIAQRRDRTVGEVLGELGVEIMPETEALAAAIWPVVKAALGSPTATAWIEGMVREFYEAEIAAAGG